MSSHVAPTTPASINKGNELGYSQCHALGTMFENPGLSDRLTYRWTNRNLHVRGYKEEGTIATAVEE